MRHIAISTALAMAATTASAQPKQEDPNERVSYVASKLKPRHEGRWLQLASPTPVKYGTVFIVVDASAGRFSQLRIDAHTGKVSLSRLRMFFEDGSIGTVALARTLDRKRNSTVIDIPSRKHIRQIAITTARYPQGAYTVHVSSSDTGIATR